MKTGNIHLIILLVLSFSCKSPRKEDQNQINKETLSISEGIEINKLSVIDTTVFIKIVADNILKSLKGQVIYKSEFDENGNYYIEFYEDTTNVAPDYIIKDYYLIERTKLILGKLNSDDKFDFAIRSSYGPTIDSLLGIEWHLYVSIKGGWERIENEFGGGKFSNMETVVSIENFELETNYQELDEETAWLKDSFEIRKYEMIENKLIRKE